MLKVGDRVVITINPNEFHGKIVDVDWEDDVVGVPYLVETEDGFKAWVTEKNIRKEDE